MLRRTWFLLATLALSAGLVAPARAGVVNPDISVIGQPLARWTDDAGDPARKRVTLDPGETEFMFEAALNPYARGTFVAAFGDEGAAIEEAYFTLTRGLPGGLALKAGQYRAGFGKLNPLHPHVYPFAERPRVMAAYLPGDEAFNETGVSLSEQLALPRDIALTATLDALQGDSFRLEREPGEAGGDPLVADPEAGDRADEPRPAVLGRLAAFVPFGDRSGLELGVSGTQGTNNVAAATRTTVLGADLKAKLWNGPRSYLLLQAEMMRLDREDAGWDSVTAAYTSSHVKPAGAYLFADYNWDTRYNVGIGFERWQRADAEKVWDQSFRAFAGLALMEETTAFRIDFERLVPGESLAEPDPEAVNTLTLRVVFSMGPHKAHQF